MHLGLDAARYQGLLPWEDLQAEGVRYVFLKATEGVRYQDPLFLANIRSCPSAIWPGAYHFFLPGRDPIEQARSFHRTAEQHCLVKPVLDFEVLRGTDPLHAAREALTFVRETERLWRSRVILYSYPYFLAPLYREAPQTMRELAEATHLWLAWYGRSTQPPPSEPWRELFMWQFDGDGGRLMPNHVDACYDYMYGDIELLLRDHPRTP